MRLFGLIGFPLTHSFSKKYFTDKFEKDGLSDCRYELFSIQSVDELKIILAQNPALEGLNVTIPYKRSVLPFLHSTQGIPGSIQACNCIKIEKGRLSGFNTDHIGFEKSFVPQIRNYHHRALILGNGGATAAVGYVLKKLKIDFDIVSRQLHHGSTLTYADLDEKTIKEHLIIINTTPVGSFPDVQHYPPLPYQFISSRHYLFDVVYNPATSLFLQKGQQQGAAIQNGYEWLVIQAEESWKIWNSKLVS